MEKNDAFFETTASGIPEPSVQWHCGSALLITSDRVLIERDGDTYRLVLSNCGVDQTGPVRVTATNKAGKAVEEAYLHVKGWTH